MYLKYKWIESCLGGGGGGDMAVFDASTSIIVGTCNIFCPVVVSGY